MNPAKRGPGKNNAEHAAHRRQQQAFGEKLADEACAARAERGTDRDLFLSRERARQQEVCDVGARDQQDESDRAHQDEKRPAHAADNLIEKRHDAERQSSVRRVDVREVAAQPRRDRVHLGLRARSRYAGPKLRDDVVVFVVACGRRRRRKRERQENLAVFGDAERRQHFARQCEALGQDADELIELAVQRDFSADDAWIATVTPHPGAVCQHGRRRGARRVFI